MNQNVAKIVFFLSLIITTAVKADNENTNVTLKGFKASYSLIHNGKQVGDAVRKLEYLNENTANFSYETNIKWLIFSDHRIESSKIKIENGVITPIEYHFVRDGTGRDKESKWSFDEKNHTATDLIDNKTIEFTWPQGLQDNISFQLQNRLNLISNPEQKTFVYPLVNKDGKIKNYVFEFDGVEEIMLPYGLVKTIKLKREVVEKKRVTYAWFAPELNYLLVKLYQMKAGAEQFEAQLTAIEEN